MFPEKTETERLCLRKIQPSDAAFVFGYACDPEVVRYVAWPASTSIEDTRRYIEAAQQGWESGQWFEYLITRRSDSAPIGAISIVRQDYAATIGYVIAPQFQGNGFATEAAAHIVAMALAAEGMWRVWTVCDVDHTASCRVLEKSGMQCEGILRRWKVRPNINPTEPRDSFCYSAVRER